MARQRISLISEEEKKEKTLKQRILEGNFTHEDFQKLSLEEQQKVNKILFDIASERVNPTIGASTLEFILFSFMRIMKKKTDNLPLNSEDLKVEEALETIMNMHQITNEHTSLDEWLFDYLAYAKKRTEEFLQNRKEHIQRKTQIMKKL